MKSGVMVAIVLVLALLLGGCEFVRTRNKLAVEKEAIGAEWSQVDADLQRRADLIPNLVETVKGYAKEETTVVQSVADARAALVGAKSPQDKIDANNQLTGALGRLLVVVENYPNLKANENFKQLQYSLEGTENRILQGAAGTTKRCRNTTPIFRCSRPMSLHQCRVSSAKTPISRLNPGRVRCQKFSFKRMAGRPVHPARRCSTALSFRLEFTI